MAQRLRQTPRCVQHVRCDDQIRLGWGKILAERRLFNIQGLVAHKGEGRKAYLGLTQEAGANIGKSVDALSH